MTPCAFENIVFAKGPSENYPRTSVNGRLDYDYETGNWFTDGIRLRATIDGKETEDVITGSIKWVQDSDRATNGKGYYEFNLRFNEDKNKTASTEGAAFEKLSDEEAFFAVDHSIPCLTGKVLTSTPSRAAPTPPSLPKSNTTSTPTSSPSSRSWPSSSSGWSASAPPTTSKEKPAQR